MTREVVTIRSIANNFITKLLYISSDAEWQCALKIKSGTGKWERKKNTELKQNMMSGGGGDLPERR